MKRSFSSSQDALVARHYGGGLSTRAIAEMFGVSQRPIFGSLQRMGVVSRSPGHPRIYTLNESAFCKPTPECAYWVGFIMADGYVADRGREKTICVSIGERDYGHLVKLRNFLGSNHPISDLGNSDDRELFRNAKPRNRLSITSKRIFADLASYGIHPRKSMTAAVVGLEFNRHFWRGIIDGDGSIFIRKSDLYPRINLVGSHNMLTQYVSFITSVIPGHVPAISNFHSIFQVGLSGTFAIRMLKYLYRSGDTALDRKMVKAQAAMKRVIARKTTSCPLS